MKGDFRQVVCMWVGTLCSSWLSTALETGRSRVRFPMVSVEFFIDKMWSTHPLREMNTRDVPGGNGGRCVGLTTFPTQMPIF